MGCYVFCGHNGRIRVPILLISNQTTRMKKTDKRYCRDGDRLSGAMNKIIRTVMVFDYPECANIIQTLRKYYVY